MTLGGYGVLIGNQVKKSFVRGLRFDSIQDRNVSLFFYLPSSLPESTVKKFEMKMRKISSHISINSSMSREGRLFHVNLKIGSAVLPLSEIKLHLRRFEDRFYREYQHLFSYRNNATMKSLTQLRLGNDVFPNILTEMSSFVPAGERREARQVLSEFLKRQDTNLRYLLNSTLCSAWTLEIPPSEQQELLQHILPGLLVEDLSMTNLAEETEHFKKHVIYGLDSIAELASETSLRKDEILERPDRFQLVPLFEPIRGRIMFVGRTEQIEKHLDKFGSLFFIQIWSGYCDNLLADTNLNLYSIVQSLSSNLSEDLTNLRDGELWQLHRFVEDLCLMQVQIEPVLARIRKSAGLSKARLRDLKAFSQVQHMSRTRLLEAVLALNTENIASLPTRLKDTASLCKTSFAWSNALLKIVDAEFGKRQAKYAGSSFLMRPFTRRVPRHPSPNFVRVLARIYGLTSTLGNLIVGGRVLDPLEVLESQKEGEEREEKAPEKLEPRLVPA
jgi:hypothetical protein